MQVGKSDWTMPCDRGKGGQARGRALCYCRQVTLTRGIHNSRFTITYNRKFKVNARSYEGRAHLTK